MENSSKKSDLVLLIKEELIEIVTSLTINNISEFVNHVSSQLNILEAIENAKFLPSTSNKTEEKNTILKKAPDAPETLAQSFVDYISPDEKIIRGVFKQNLRGGTIHKNKTVYVPERLVRDLDIQEGDYVEAKQISYDNGRPQYEYQVLTKNVSPPKNHRELASFKIVDSHSDFPDRLCITLENEDCLSITVLLSDEDISNFKIKKGDIIDYAFRKDSPQNGRTVWKYSLYEKNSVNIDYHNKNKEKKEKQIKEIKNYAPIFQDLHILMIGGENQNLQRNVEKEVLKRKGFFDFCSGDEPEKTIISKIRKSQIVIVYTESISHKAMHLAKETCKKEGIQISFTKNMGGSSFVKRVSQLKKKILA